QSDEKILLAGAAGLVRLNADGTLDTSFSEDGKVPANVALADASANPNLMDVAVQPNGRIVLSGKASDKVVVARLLSGTGAEINVEDPDGNALASGAAAPVDFGTVLAGETKSLIFTVRNTGLLDLTDLAVSKAAGGTSAAFSLGTAPATTLAPAASATFTVT